MHPYLLSFLFIQSQKDTAAMEKQKRWQFYLIIAVLVLTLYNILPTVFYYSRSLHQPVDASRSKGVAEAMIDRVNDLEGDSLAWLKSFSHLLGIKPQAVQVDEKNPGMIEVAFNSSADANLFKRFLPKAGLLIPFIPSQLELAPQQAEQQEATKVVISRNLSVHVTPAEVDQLFQFTKKYDDKGNITDFYKTIIDDRISQLALALGGSSKPALQMLAVVNGNNDPRLDDIIIALAKEIVDKEQVLGRSSPITKRFYASFTQVGSKEADGLVQKFTAKMEGLSKQIADQKEVLTKEQTKLKEQGQLLDSSKQQLLAVLDNQQQALQSALTILKKNSEDFGKGSRPLTASGIQTLLAESAKKLSPQNQEQVVNLEGYNPFFKSLAIDWQASKVTLNLYPDMQTILDSEGKAEKEAYIKEKVGQSLFNEIARVAYIADETITPSDSQYAIELNRLINSQSFLTFNLGYLANKRSEQILDQLLASWNPQHSDLKKDSFPLLSYTVYKKLKAEDQKLGLVVYAPAAESQASTKGFKTSSIYIIARGVESLIQKYREAPEAEESKKMMADFNELSQTLQAMGFIGYPAASFDMGSDYSKDYIFELNDYYTMLLEGTREDFVVKGSKRYAVLDFTDVEQRILAVNKIDERIQEDLVKWREAYQTAQVDLNLTNRYVVPAPTKNIFWENFKLSFVKYFRGDERKVLKWGLDLSGGKTVRIGLLDRNNRPVTDPEDLKQAVDELYTRINKMGVSERRIRIENNNIILDFPGSQGLSASELVKASAMYFHVVNEKFGRYNTTMAPTVNQFLQDVWNEAVVTNRKDIDSINEIAWQHLGGDASSAGSLRPRSDAAKFLFDNGLRLANPKEKAVGNTFEDTLSSIAVFRGDDFHAWENQTNPLLIVFHNYALEGSSLDNVQVGYDSSEGNILMFGVKSSYEGSQGAAGGNPRDDFYAWTSQFAEDKIGGTPKEIYSNGQGWRMAVILNGSIITSPKLSGALKESARISGRFSQREINQLAADLKAGSLSFTPRILSEENVSPELGQEERTRGIAASLVAAALVVVAMTAYYHFAGLVASCAVLLNIFIMWGVLQNLDAAITLPGIAGIVLTIGMAVDANVLVFERIREEFKISSRIGPAIQAGYRKAFSAIVDSNITTIIAAVILIQFDSGPIKGFAVTLIIGILSSMFTSLFMTRYFFAGWVQNPKNKELTMSQFLGKTNFDFLSKTRPAMIISVVLMVFGSYLLMSERKTIFGMDFTGGYALTIDLTEKAGVDSYRVDAMDALMASGASRNDIEVRQLSRPNQLRIQLGTSMEEKGHPFYQMSEVNYEGKFAYEYQKDPRLNWVVQSLQAANLQVEPAELTNLEKNWTVMSGQLSDAMRNNAVIALVAALLAILVYITFRFEFKFAVAAVAGLAHDVIITLGLLAFFHYLGFAVQIDLQVIGAIMTIIGYSLNDTIIVFDRIREDMRLMRKMKFNEIINHALNVTLSRTIMTSGTTMIVLVVLVLLGGQSIFAFSLVMTIGVVIGTLSSLFIAPPVLLYLHNREIREAAAEGLKRA
jgi:SecD/SecF fusion protein